MENLNELLIEELKDLYSAEKQIVKALPKLVKAAEAKELKAAFSEHLEVTKGHITRLEEAFAAASAKASAKHCKGMEGLLEEGAECIKEDDPGEFRDLKLIGAAQRVEHYEMAAYGTARAIAEQCGLQDCVELLAQTLEEESAADESLTKVAEGIYAAMTKVSEEVGEDEEEMALPSGKGRAK